MRRRALLSVILALSASCVAEARAEEPPLATLEEIDAALAAFKEWTAAFQAGDYRAQRLLTDARIRRWHDNKRWKDRMTKAARRDGDLLTYAIEAAAPAQAKDLPCTELGHCFRSGIKYVVFLIRSDYETAEPPQPEFAVMAHSKDGWRFGGGTFPNRPLGETAVIMTAQDEQRYKPGVAFNP